jgi:hypothetical protein
LLLAGFLAGFLLATGGCSGDSRSSQEPCVPGASARCTCETGATGAKTCIDGVSFTECQCVGPAGSGGAAGSGQTLPPVTDYAAPGPFATVTVNNTGPDGQYTMFRPTTLGETVFCIPR